MTDVDKTIINTTFTERLIIQTVLRLKRNYRIGVLNINKINNNKNDLEIPAQEVTDEENVTVTKFVH